jgi:hypothetical protein
VKRAANAAAGTDSPATIEGIVRSSTAANHLRAAIVQVRRDGTAVYTGAFGESMTGVPTRSRAKLRNFVMPPFVGDYLVGAMQSGHAVSASTCPTRSTRTRSVGFCLSR